MGILVSLLLALVVAAAIGVAATWYLRRVRLPREEAAAGVAALSDMRWRDFIKLVLDVLAGRGFTRVSDPEAASDEGDIPLERDGELWLLSSRHGASYVLVGSGSRNGIQLITAVLGTSSEAARDNDTMALLNWAIPKFQRIRAVVEGKVMAKVPIRDRQGATLSLAPDRTVRRIIERGKRDEITTEVVAPDVVDGPIRSGQRLGRVEVRQDGKLVATVALVAKSAVPAP